MKCFTGGCVTSEKDKLTSVGIMYLNVILTLLFGRQTASFAHIATFSYQSPDFYRAMGFEVFGVINDYPEGIKEYFLKKRL